MHCRVKMYAKDREQKSHKMLVIGSRSPQSQRMTNRPSNIQKGKPNSVETANDPALDWSKPCQRISSQLATYKLFGGRVNGVIMPAWPVSKIQVVPYFLL